MAASGTTFGIGSIGTWLDAEALASTARTVGALIMVLAAPTFLVWLYRARVNAQVMDTSGGLSRKRLGPGWSIGSWFVPVGFLWLPLLVVRDVWNAAGDTRARTRSSLLLSAWWLSWVLGWLTAIRVQHTETIGADGGTVTNDTLSGYFGQTGISGLFAATAGILCMIMIRRVSAAQHTRIAL